MACLPKKDTSEPWLLDNIEDTNTTTENSDETWQADDVEDSKALRENEVHMYCRVFEETLQTHKRIPKQNKSLYPDAALVAFAQLGTFRLHARRALISLFDQTHQYVLAETTRTLSLTKDTTEDDRDLLCFGPGTVPRFGFPCEHTTGLHPSTEDESRRQDGICLIPDLRRDERFSTLKFVTEAPCARFYAGVPLMTENNITIGSYCILDDEPRVHLPPADVDFMHEIAATIVSHLDMLRATAELKQSQRLIAGLSKFVSTRPSLIDWRPSSVRKKTTKGSKLSPVVPSRISSRGPRQPLTRSSDGIGRTSSPLSHDSNFAKASSSRAATVVINQSVTCSSPSHLPPDDLNENNISMLQEELVPSDVRSTFSKAADIIRDAVDLDGVIFMDASVNKFGGLVDDPDRATIFTRRSRSSTTSSQTEAGALPTAQEIDDMQSLNSKDCLILGESHRSHSLDALSVTEDWLSSLLSRYPRGKIWNFDRLGSIPLVSHEIASTATEGLQDVLNRKGTRSKDRDTIKATFPGVQSLAFTTLWDSRRDRWYAGSISWTCNPSRVLSAAELDYLVAFNQSIMSEVSLLDVSLASQAKDTFISSISHELRTPLHGILGSLDCLQSTELDGLQQTLTATIDTCGRTLLDTFDNLLSHAKINFMSSQNSSMTSQARTGKMGPKRPIDIANLATLAEEAVEAVVAAHEFTETTSLQSGQAHGVSLHHARKTTAAIGIPGKRKLSEVNISVVYASPASSAWTMQAQPGLWRRIMLNLVGNALKYTEKGYVRIELNVTPYTNEGERAQDCSEFKISVCDSGKGMSKSFIRSRLFSPFSQEDPLSPGTGLGMSIVKDIVESLGGQISVKSKQGTGTTFTVTAPLMRRSNFARASQLHYALEQCAEAGNHLIVLESEHACDGPQDTTWTFAEICKRGLGLIPDHKSRTGDGRYLTIIDEGYLQSSAGEARVLSIRHKTALIVLCQDKSSVRERQASGLRFAFSGHVVFTCHPYVPSKVAYIVASCLSQPRLHKETTLELPGVSATILLPMAGVGTPPVTSPPQLGDLSKSSGTRQGGADSVPARIASVNDRGMAGPDLQEPVQLPSTTRTSVLIVDDNTINQRLLQSYMSKAKRSYTLAADGIEAVEAYQQAILEVKQSHSDLPAYDLILMDLNMPRMDGTEATRRIREQEHQLGLRATKIVAITGTASAEIQQEAFASASGVDT